MMMILGSSMPRDVRDVDKQWREDSGQWAVDGRQLPMSFAYLSAAGLTDEIADQTSAKSVQLTIDSWDKNGNRGIRMGNELQCGELMDQLRLSRNTYKA